MPVLKNQSYRILCIFSAVGSIGSGNGGGVEITLRNFCKALSKNGHQITVIAPEFSVLEGIQLVPISGQLQISAERPQKNDPVTVPTNSTLANMMDYARTHQYDYDVIINFGYDWLPYYLTPYFDTPVLHYVNMSAQTDALDMIICKVARKYPSHIGFQTQSQADTFADDLPHFRIVKGFDLERYHFVAQGGTSIAWAGRIIRVKGLEDAFEVAQRLDVPLKVMGYMSDQDYWNEIIASYPSVNYQYFGYLSTDEFQAELGTCQALLTPIKWEEAFGNVVVEAFACGVPVVGYRRGSLPELIQDGKTGWLVEVDDTTALAEATKKIGLISRDNCRKYAERHHSLAAMAANYEKWIQIALNKNHTK